MDDHERIDIIAVDGVAPSLLRGLLRPLEARFDRPAATGPAIPPRPDWYDPERGQYRADRILDDLAAETEEPDAWILAVVDADLYAPGLNFIFGQATVGGCCAVIGLSRLRDGRDGGRRVDDERFRSRVLTEAVHELGHVAGLGHCSSPRCVMYFSNTLIETDRKGPDFCERCRPDAVRRAA